MRSLRGVVAISDHRSAGGEDERVSPQRGGAQKIPDLRVHDLPGYSVIEA